MKHRLPALCLALLATVLLPVAMMAQPVIDMPLTEIKWEKTAHVFGQHEEGEQLEYTFNFTNTGKNPLKVYQVNPACGCTTPDYSKDIIDPGDQGYVKVIFDSRGRQGYQNKMVTVFTNTDPQSTILTFTADIYAGPPPGPEDQVKTGDTHPQNAAYNQQATEAANPPRGVYFPEQTFNFGLAHEGDSVVHEFTFLNTSNLPVQILSVKASCGCTTPDWPKDPIPTGGKGTIKVTFDTKGKEGNQSKTITVVTDSEPKVVTLTLSGAVLMGAHGRMQLSEVMWDIDTESKPKKLVKKVTLSNVGDAPLKIEKYESTCPCISVKYANTEVPAGGSTEVVVTRSFKKCSCNEYESIIFTTDGYPAEAGMTIKHGQ